MAFKCRNCKYDMLNGTNLKRHEAFCGSNSSSGDNACLKCNQDFISSDALFFHMRKCGKFVCFECGFPYFTSEALNFHIESTHRQTDPWKMKQCSCSLCYLLFESREELHTHRMNQHDGNGNQKDLPHYILGQKIKEFRDVYTANRQYILAEHHHGEVKHCLVYNFPTNNLTGEYKEIRGHLIEIYNERDFGFGVHNIGFGMILFNSQTGKYRYYTPQFNNKDLDNPVSILCRSGIGSLMDEIENIEVIEEARSITPSEDWTLAFIANVQYKVFVADYPLIKAMDQCQGI